MNTRNIIRVSLFMVLFGAALISLLFEHSTKADSPSNPSTSNTATVRSVLPTAFKWSKEIDGPMCGIYATCRALQILGTEVGVESLWRSKYVGRMDGSTPAEIASAVRDNGFEARLISSMTKLELDSMGSPVIANVRKHPEDSAFNHWVCVQTTSNGYCVYDGANPGRELSAPEFLASWSGLGIVVSRSDKTHLLSSITRLAGIGCLLMVVYIVIASPFARFTSLNSSSSVVKDGLRMTVAVIVSMSTGFLMYGVGPGHTSAMSIVKAPYELEAIKQGSLDDVMAAASNPDALLIDARTEDSYKGGTIASAVNIPVTATYHDIKTYLQGVPKDTRFVVFCQSVRCAYDDHIAKVLVQLGFRDVTVSDRGYMEYKSQHVESKSRLTSIAP